MNPEELVVQAHEQGLRLEPRGRVFAVIPGGKCPKELAETLRAYKGEVLAWLEAGADNSMPPTVEVPVSSIRLCRDMPNFKRKADAKTGVVHGKKLLGKYVRLATAPVVVWKRQNGEVELITGRHRFDLALRNRELTIPAQIVYESQGFTKEMALALDAEANIRDGQGTTEDFAHYFKSKPGLSEQEAIEGSLLSRPKGKTGWALARDGSADLYAAWMAGKVEESVALAIVRAAPANDAAQQIGLKFALQGKPTEFVENIVKAALAESKGHAEALDLLGADESALQAMAEQAARAAAIQRDLRLDIAAVRDPAKHPQRAKRLGVDVNDPERTRTRLAQLEAGLERWRNWPLHADLVARTKRPEEKAAPAPVLPPESNAELIAPTGPVQLAEKLSPVGCAADLRRDATRYDFPGQVLATEAG